MNTFGISERSYFLIWETLKNFPQVEKAVIFGSRAKGNFVSGSDIDLAIFGKDCNPELALKISACLNEEIPIPYYVDVLDFNSLTNNNLKEHITRVGKI